MNLQNERDLRRFSVRVTQAFIGLLILTALLLTRLSYLQVVQHEHYSTLSTQNRIAVVPIPPTRGLILDRKGRILAENRPMYTLELVTERVPDLDRTLQGLQRLLPISEDDVKSFRRNVKRKRAFEGVVLRSDLTDEEVGTFAIHRHEFPGVAVNARLRRVYPHGMLASHLLGYVGRLNGQDLKRINPDEYAGLDYIGKDGVEKAYESLLRGQAGYKQVEINSHGRVIRDLDVVPAVPGQNLVLSIDLDVQRAAEAAIGERQGAAVAMDTETGEVLALASMPGYDPNWFVDGISNGLWNALQKDPYHPMTNRFLRGMFPPGSTLKPFVAMAGLETGVVTPETPIYCPGYFRLPGKSHKYHCWKHGGHGNEDARLAIAQSCDVYFYTVAMNLGIQRMHDSLQQFGFGQKTGIDLLGEKSGVLPSPEWKRKRFKQVWYPGETVIAGIGQGYMLTTPLQLARATAMVANGGVAVQPRVGRFLQDQASGRQQSLLARPGQIQHMSQRDLQVVREGMQLVVTGGTATNINRGPVTIAGKTGSAQVAGLRRDASGRAINHTAEELKDHALFIAYAPVEQPRIAVSVIIEHGAHGNTAAAPVARTIVDAYLAPPVPSVAPKTPLTVEAAGNTPDDPVPSADNRRVALPSAGPAPVAGDE